MNIEIDRDSFKKRDKEVSQVRYFYHETIDTTNENVTLYAYVEVKLVDKRMPETNKLYHEEDFTLREVTVDDPSNILKDWEKDELIKRTVNVYEKEGIKINLDDLSVLGRASVILDKTNIVF